MNFTQTVRMAFKSITGNKMRSILTMLGIIIGVASVIMAIGLMDGIYGVNLNGYIGLGAKIITLDVTNVGSRQITNEDAGDWIKKEPELFQGGSPLVSGRVSLSRGNKFLEEKTITGVGEEYKTIKSLKLDSGKFFHYADVYNRNNVCIIGTYIRDELFSDTDVIGESISINGSDYTVIGIRKEEEKGRKDSEDDCVYIPYSNAQRLLDQPDISTFLFGLYDTSQIEQGETVIEEEAYQRMKDKELFQVSSWLVLLSEMETQMVMLKAVAIFIAGISLAVAGTGIMNIMLVSVVERTREIGIRKALGATQVNILLQFVLEAVSISVISGLIGIAVGVLLTVVLAGIIGFETSASMGAIVISFGVSASIGIIFGYMPAKRAAKMAPIDALRSE